MTTAPAPLPSFSNPPLVEVAFSAAFEPVPGVTVAHLGRWWESLGRSEFPTCQEQQPLAQVLESFDSPQTTQISISDAPVPRLWFVSGNDQEVVQVQRDRFLCNWRKTPTGVVYPHYDAVSGDFFTRLAAYEHFVREETGNSLSFTQFELTYINHVVEDAIHSGFSGIGRVLPDFGWRVGERFLPPPSGLEARTSFELPDRRSRLHVKTNTGVRRADGRPVLILDLTVRGSGDDQRSWFASAHEWVVRGFADLTSEEAHKSWGRTQ